MLEATIRILEIKIFFESVFPSHENFNCTSS